jgi:hypothetical protein
MISGFGFSPFSSPGITDRIERRKSLVLQQLEELMASGEKYNMRMPVTTAVCEELIGLEDTHIWGSREVGPELFLGRLNRLVEEHHFKSKNGSIHEARYWLVRFLTVLSIVNALYFLLIH